MWRLLLTVCVLTSALKGVVGVIDAIDPPNNTTVTRRIGDANTTFNCSVFAQAGRQVTTLWNIENIRGVADLRDLLTVLGDDNIVKFDGISSNGTGFFPTFRNELTFTEFIEDFDGATLICGTGENLRAGRWSLRVYREPLLQNLTDVIRIKEGKMDLVVDLQQQARPANPFPITVQWFQDGALVSNDSDREFSYPTVTFLNVNRLHGGVYSLRATNFLPDDPSEVVGTGVGSFTLDVLYGPDILPGPMQVAVRLGDPLSLVCGTNLMSNPSAAITWRDPNGVVDNTRYDLVNDGTGIRLNFTNTISSDTGTWTCSVLVEGNNVTVGNKTQPRLLIGERNITIDLTVVESPGIPRNLSVEEIGSTHALLCWQVPLNQGQPAITGYIITATDIQDNSSVAITNTNNNASRFNITNLIPGVTYEFIVQAVASFLNVAVIGSPSNSVMDTTDPAAPAPFCHSAISDGGNIDIEWSFNHTGGRPLNSVSISYVFDKGSGDLTKSGPTVTIKNLVAGYSYVAMVTAANANGSTTVECPPVTHNIGIPQTPQPPLVRQMSGGRVQVMVRTLASGITVGERLFFILDQISNGSTITHNMSILNYVSGGYAEINIDGLDFGEAYTFTVRVQNKFGTSGVSKSSTPIVITGAPPPPPPTTNAPGNANAGAIAGGVIGGLVALVILIAVIIIIIFLYLRFYNYRASYEPAATKMKEEPVGVKVEIVKEGSSPDIGQELNKCDAPPITTKEIQYAELDSFQPPTSSPNSNGETVKSPPPPELQPVEYATIDLFKKAPASETKPSESTAAEGDNKAGTPATVI